MNHPGGSDNGYDERFRVNDYDNTRPWNNQQRDSYPNRDNRNSGQSQNRNWNDNRNEFGINQNDSYRRNESGVNNYDTPDNRRNQRPDFDEFQRGRHDHFQHGRDDFSTCGTQHTDFRRSEDQESQRNLEYSQGYRNDRFGNENQGRFREDGSSLNQNRFDHPNYGENRRNEQQNFDDRRRMNTEYQTEYPSQDGWNSSCNRNTGGKNNYGQKEDDRFYSSSGNFDRNSKNDYGQGSQNYRQGQGSSNNRGVERSRGDGEQFREEPWIPIKEPIESLTDMERRRASNICTKMDYQVHTFSGDRVIELKPAKKLGDIANAHTVETLLVDVGYKQLRPIQKVASPYIQAGNDVFLRSSSGSGKTAAYLMPLVDRIVQEKKNIDKVQYSPFVLIICPSLELVKHLYEVSRVFCADTLIECAMIVGMMGFSSHVMNFDADILIGTPLKLAAMLDEQRINLKSTFSIIVEETDWYWDHMAEAVDVIFQHSEIRNHQQRICVTGTFPQAFRLPDYFRQDIGIICYTKPPLPAVIHRFERVNQLSFARKLIQEIKNGKDGLHKCLIIAQSMRVRAQVLQLLAENNIDTKDYVILKNEGLTPVEREAVLNQFSNDKLRVLISHDNALLRGIRIPNIRKIIHLDAPIVTDRLPSILCTFHHRLGPVAFSTEGESVFLLNVDEKNNIDMVKALAEAMDVVPDWMYRVARQGSWIVDDKMAADGAGKEPEVAKVEPKEEEDRYKRKYNPQYQRQGWNRYPPRNNYYQNNHGYSGFGNYNSNLGYPSEPMFPAFEAMTMTPPPQVQQQIQKMYAPPVAAPFVAPDKQLIFEGNDADFSSPILFDPNTLQTIRNDDGYMQVFQIKTTSSGSPAKSEIVTAPADIKMIETAAKEAEQISAAHSPADSTGSSFIQVDTPKFEEENHSLSEHTKDNDSCNKNENSEEPLCKHEEKQNTEGTASQQTPSFRNTVDDSPSET